MSEALSQKTNQRKQLKNPSNASFLVFSFVLMCVTLLAVNQPIAPNDFFPYLRIGEEIIKTGEIPTTEFMTYTQFGQPALYLYWLPSILFYEMFQFGGVILIALIVMLCTASFYGLFWLCLRELNIRPLVSGLVLIIIGLPGASFFVARPQIFAFPFFALVFLILIRWQKGNDRLLWLLPLAGLLWANFHGSFIILFFLLLPALLFGKGNRRRLLIFTGISFFATLINRYGIGIWTNMFSLVNNLSSQTFSMEFQPPLNNDWQANIFFGSLLIIPVLTAFKKPKIQFLYWIWFLGFGWMALSGLRYRIWFLGVEAIILSMLLNPLFDRFFKPSNRFQNRSLNLALGVIMLVFPLALLPGVRGLWWEQAPPKYSETTPIRAVNWLKQNPHLPGELWSDFTYATYMTYTLPERKLFTTNRMEDFPVHQFEDYQSISNAQYNWQELLEEYEINLLMTSRARQPTLINAAYKSQNWSAIYSDVRTIIYIRSDLIQ